MDHVPEKHQSIAPPRSMLIGLLGLLLMFAAIWFGVAAAVNYGGDGCPTTKENTRSLPARCR